MPVSNFIKMNINLKFLNQVKKFIIFMIITRILYRQIQIMNKQLINEKLISKMITILVIKKINKTKQIMDSNLKEEKMKNLRRKLI